MVLNHALGSEADPKTLKNGLWRGGEAADGNMGQNGKFGEMENAIDWADEDDDFL
jgi:hypothetical protein